ncbi:hypothetical protein CesoFtcFv8_003497 [Champsocephalus esox]|uniref:Uncharacterized protein n=2 Tax=Champsocephalus TaxID=52236 RepID=A0AAN8DZW3_CHAGU|nr:hypothetical protein CesoFtcFv8_003497 [Champsocephalus esox]KAK5932191.1 hypothetical protein CgunFtcFv8_003916 [Champsocephalus gunnari]
MQKGMCLPYQHLNPHESNKGKKEKEIKREIVSIQMQKPLSDSEPAGCFLSGAGCDPSGQSGRRMIRLLRGTAGRSELLKTTRSCLETFDRLRSCSQHHHSLKACCH